MSMKPVLGLLLFGLCTVAQTQEMDLVVGDFAPNHYPAATVLARHTPNTELKALQQQNVSLRGLSLIAANRLPINLPLPFPTRSEPPMTRLQTLSCGDGDAC